MSDMKKIITLGMVASILVLNSARGADKAPLTYQKIGGTSGPVQMVTGIAADGTAQVPAYVGTDGKNHSPIVEERVCSVLDGVAYLCSDSSGGGSPGLVVDAATSYVSIRGDYPDDDPLVAGQAWQDNGVMMLSTGSVAAPTFDGSKLKNVATLDSNGNVTASVLTSGEVRGSMLTATTSASVPDTSAADATTAALNTESANSRFLSKSSASSFITSDALVGLLKTSGGNMTGDLYLNNGISMYACDKGSSCANLYNSGNQTLTWTGVGGIVVGGDANIQGKVTAGRGLSVTGAATAPTPDTGDNSTNIATTAYVNNAFQAVEYSVQGDISTAGSSIQIAFGTSGLYAKEAYAASGAASMSFCSTSGTLSPVDIRRNSIWGGSGVETYTLDNGSVGTDCVVADSTVYTQSNDSSAYFIRVGGTVYFLTVWASNNGSRAFMGVHKMI